MRVCVGVGGGGYAGPGYRPVVHVCSLCAACVQLVRPGLQSGMLCRGTGVHAEQETRTVVVAAQSRCCCVKLDSETHQWGCHACASHTAGRCPAGVCKRGPAWLHRQPGAHAHDQRGLLLHAGGGRASGQNLPARGYSTWPAALPHLPSTCTHMTIGAGALQHPGHQLPWPTPSLAPTRSHVPKAQATAAGSPWLAHANIR